MRRDLIFSLVTLVAVIALVYICYYIGAFRATVNALYDFGPDWVLAIVNATVATTLVIVTALQMMESRRMRLESVRPSLSIQPSRYLAGGGAFLSLHLVNGGGVAKDVDIDVFYKGATTLLTNPSIGTGERVPVLDGHFPQDGGVVQVQVTCKDAYGKKQTETLSIDFDSLNKAKRQFTYITSALDAIADRISDLKGSILF